MIVENKKIKASVMLADQSLEMTWDEALAMIREHKACRLDDATDKPHIGWASGNCELITDVTAENSVVADRFLDLTMRITVRKPQASMVRALLRKKIAEYKKENGVSFLSGKIRRELKQEVLDYILPSTIPTVKSVWVVLDKCDGQKCRIYSGAVTESDKSALAMLIYETFKMDVKTLSLNDILFTHGVQELDGNEDLCFLTDLYFSHDVGETVVPPVYLVDPEKEQKAIKISVSGVEAMDSAEVRAAFAQKKKCSKLCMVLSGEAVPGMWDERDCWQFTLDRSGNFTGLALPETEEIEPNAVFGDRMRMIGCLFTWLECKYFSFADKIQVRG